MSNEYDEDVTSECKEETGKKVLYHHELLYMIDAANIDAAYLMSGRRTSFLVGTGVKLQMAVKNYAIHFLQRNKYNLIQIPCYILKEILMKTINIYPWASGYNNYVGVLSCSDKEEDKRILCPDPFHYLAAYHQNDILSPIELPLRYASIGTALKLMQGFAGWGWGDVYGILRRQKQYEMVDQFIICSPSQSDFYTTKIREECKRFYAELEIECRFEMVISEELSFVDQENGVCVEQYDVLLWFPSRNKYLTVSTITNFKDALAKRLNVEYGIKNPKYGNELLVSFWYRQCNGNDLQQVYIVSLSMDIIQVIYEFVKDIDKKYVHMIHCNFIPMNKIICAILENYQTDDGVIMPNVLHCYLGDTTFMPFVRLPSHLKRRKKGKK